jgi:hypothetical protein
VRLAPPTIKVRVVLPRMPVRVPQSPSGTVASEAVLPRGVLAPASINIPAVAPPAPGCELIAEAGGRGTIDVCPPPPPAIQLPPEPAPVARSPAPGPITLAFVVSGVSLEPLQEAIPSSTHPPHTLEINPARFTASPPPRAQYAAGVTARCIDPSIGVQG